MAEREVEEAKLEPAVKWKGESKPLGIISNEYKRDRKKKSHLKPIIIASIKFSGILSNSFTPFLLFIYRALPLILSQKGSKLCLQHYSYLHYNVSLVSATLRLH